MSLLSALADESFIKKEKVEEADNGVEPETATPVSQMTTGWQRWCSAVRTATTTSQLHLLARALERAARRGHKGGRGVPAAISAVASQYRLPQLRCLACW